MRALPEFTDEGRRRVGEAATALEAEEKHYSDANVIEQRWEG